MDVIQIQNKDRPLTRPLQAGYCRSFLCRLRGLMFRFLLAPDQGLLLVQPRDSRLDSAIHMLFVFMDLAVIWINSDNVVVDTVLARAWRPAYVPRAAAKYILEIHPDRLNEFSIGDHAEFAHE
ncbi:MAG: DUF192 domain-containing protein [Chloroflexi bacterium]|nr:DUF192 domain-containing protein [Chloroflexota bacterium]